MLCTKTLGANISIRGNDLAIKYTKILSPLSKSKKILKENKFGNLAYFLCTKTLDANIPIRGNDLTIKYKQNLFTIEL